MSGHKKWSEIKLERRAGLHFDLDFIDEQFAYPGPLNPDHPNGSLIRLMSQHIRDLEAKLDRILEERPS